MVKTKEHKILEQLTASQVKSVRDKILELQNGICPLCQNLVQKQEATLDHQHKTVKTTPGTDGGGLVRGVLCRACNCAEGKFWNASIRYLCLKTTSERVKYLESLVKYYESGTYPLIHHTEKPKLPNLSKRNYNKLKKMYNTENTKTTKKKFPEFPKSGKLTKNLKILFEKFDVQPFNS